MRTSFRAQRTQIAIIRNLQRRAREAASSCRSRHLAMLHLEEAAAVRVDSVAHAGPCRPATEDKNAKIDEAQNLPRVRCERQRPCRIRKTKRISHDQRSQDHEANSERVRSGQLTGAWVCRWVSRGRAWCRSQTARETPLTSEAGRPVSPGAIVRQQAGGCFHDVLDVGEEMLAIFSHSFEPLAAPFLPSGHCVRDGTGGRQF